LQAGGQGFESPKLHFYQANTPILTMDGALMPLTCH
jgi:hypothetical protein